MTTKLYMPKLGVSVTQATLVEWLVEDGAAVEVDQAIYLLATDKTETEIEAPVAGTIRQTAVPGEDYDVGALLGEIT